MRIPTISATGLNAREEITLQPGDTNVQLEHALNKNACIITNNSDSDVVWWKADADNFAAGEQGHPITPLGYFEAWSVEMMKYMRFRNPSSAPITISVTYMFYHEL